MMFEIGYSKHAIKFLKSADKNLSIRILKKIENLKENPVQHDSKIIEGYAGSIYRVRVGDYRILYEVDYKGNLIGIVKIDKRSRIYH